MEKMHFLSCYKGVPRGLKVFASTQDKHANNKCTQSALQGHTFTDNYYFTWDARRLPTQKYVYKQNIPHFYCQYTTTYRSAVVEVSSIM